MTPRPHPDKDTLLMMLSAYLDGELAAADEAVVLDALSQDAELLEVFEAMSAARLDGIAGLPGPLGPDEADALTASVMAATEPAEVPATVEGALYLASLGLDDALDGRGATRLHDLLQEPAIRDAAPVVAGFVFSVEATQAALRGVAEVASVKAGLGSLPDHVDARLATVERTGVLASAACDDALVPAEATELGALLEGLRGDPDGLLGITTDLAHARHLGEALRAASDAPAFARLGARAGAAALQALEAEARQEQNQEQKETQAAALAARNDAPAPPSSTWLSRLRGAFAAARAPLALAGAATAVFFVLREPAPHDDASPGAETVAAREATEKALLEALARNVLTEAPSAPSGDLPLLADNSADVEAIDATDTTVVFSTESSNITIIWLASEEDTEQGT